MKNILGIFVIAVISVMSFSSCDPIENRQVMQGATTMDRINQFVTVTQEKSADGKGTNYLQLVSDGLDALSGWDFGNGTCVGTSNRVQLVLLGENTVVFTALNGDGTTLQKSFTVNVDTLIGVSPAWGWLCGSGSKDWTWDTSVGNPYGMGDALWSNSADWWGPDISTNPEGPGATMTFSVRGASLTKNLTDGSTVKGAFGFAMGTVNPPGYTRSVGTLSTTIPVLVGQTTGAETGIGASGKDVKVYQMIKLDDDHLWLSWPEKSFKPSDGWGQATLWFFKPAK